MKDILISYFLIYLDIFICLEDALPESVVLCQRYFYFYFYLFSNIFIVQMVNFWQLLFALEELIYESLKESREKLRPNDFCTFEYKFEIWIWTKKLNEKDRNFITMSKITALQTCKHWFLC